MCWSVYLWKSRPKVWNVRINLGVSAEFAPTSTWFPSQRVPTAEFQPICYFLVRVAEKQTEPNILLLGL